MNVPEGLGLTILILRILSIVGPSSSGTFIVRISKLILRILSYT